MGSLFVEASAKTSIGVHRAFTDVVKRIMDTPDLWTPVNSVNPDRGTAQKAGDSSRHATMPGNIDLNDSNETYDSGCAC